MCIGFDCDARNLHLVITNTALRRLQYIEFVMMYIYVVFDEWAMTTTMHIAVMGKRFSWLLLGNITYSAAPMLFALYVLE